jgi:hypothetical protein
VSIAANDKGKRCSMTNPTKDTAFSIHTRGEWVACVQATDGLVFAPVITLESDASEHTAYFTAGELRELAEQMDYFTENGIDLTPSISSVRPNDTEPGGRFFKET